MSVKKDTITRKVTPIERIANKILVIRGKKVILDKDLAELYGVETKMLNRAVKRKNSQITKPDPMRLIDKETRIFYNFVGVEESVKILDQAGLLHKRSLYPIDGEPREYWIL